VGTGWSAADAIPLSRLKIGV
jgi:hypothetical protein